MRIRPSLLVAVAVAMLAGVLGIARASRSTEAERTEAAIAAELKAWHAYLEPGRPYLAETNASLDRLSQHHELVARPAGCQFERCYVMHRAPRIAAVAFRRLLTTIGADSSAIPNLDSGGNARRVAVDRRATLLARRIAVSVAG